MQPKQTDEYIKNIIRENLFKFLVSDKPVLDIFGVTRIWNDMYIQVLKDDLYKNLHKDSSIEKEDKDGKRQIRIFKKNIPFHTTNTASPPAYSGNVSIPTTITSAPAEATDSRFSVPIFSEEKQRMMNEEQRKITEQKIKEKIMADAKDDIDVILLGYESEIVVENNKKKHKIYQELHQSQPEYDFIEIKFSPEQIKLSKKPFTPENIRYHLRKFVRSQNNQFVIPKISQTDFELYNDIINSEFKIYGISTEQIQKSSFGKQKPITPQLFFPVLVKKQPLVINSVAMEKARTPKEIFEENATNQLEKFFKSNDMSMEIELGNAVDNTYNILKIFTAISYQLIKKISEKYGIDVDSTTFWKKADSLSDSVNDTKYIRIDKKALQKGGFGIYYLEKMKKYKKKNIF